MIVDSSALLALLANAPAAPQVAAVLAGTRGPVIAAPTLAETLIILTARHGPTGRTVFERLRSEIKLAVLPFDDAHAAAAQRAYLRFGINHRSRGLAFSDCLTYAAADLAQDPLLATNGRFESTDLEFGDGIIGYWPTPLTASRS